MRPTGTDAAQSVGVDERETDNNDETIVRRVLAGDREAFRLLAVRHRQRLYALAWGVLRHPKDAEDALQEALVRMYLSLPQYKGQSFQAWSARIAVNCAIDLRRKRERTRQWGAGPADGTEPRERAEGQTSWTGREEAATGGPSSEGDYRSGCAPPAETEALARERKQQVRDMVDAMPEGYGAVVRAYYFEEKNQRQIAEEASLEVKSVESRLYRAKQWLRKRWKEEDFT
ncbi:RNA polymerase sigma factor (sigma-70 family) [Paenibacillus methanolicus]|uniref:RNA polymerase sigma factor (Sigma-70 family) n=2 Tax=Paenibacillus methanolicus TaxID=582686 RepID=A0A5S5CB31_9BACL|nr:RNA polymerase sigma factor (sigma-70 family) [Paenibacillus methanolicus]